MVIKLVVLFSILSGLVIVGSRLLRKSITPYNPLTWTIVEFSWYMISFAAVCVGLIELERIERLDAYKEKEKSLVVDYYNKKGLLHAQAWLLKIDQAKPAHEREGILWFHTMKGLFDEGLYTNRWEAFLNFSRGFVFEEPAAYSDAASGARQFNWPSANTVNGKEIFLREEIKWVVDTLQSFKLRKDHVSRMRPEENTNYRVRYILIAFFLVGLSLKILKIYADYRKSRPR